MINMIKIDSISDLPTSSQLQAEIKRRKYHKNYFKMLRSTVASLIVVAAIAVLISMLFLPILKVTGTSMTPTLEHEEFIVCNKQGSFESGDVVAFYFNNKILLKRVIGTAGDVIDIKDDGTVFVNGEELYEPYLNEKALGECDIELPYQVPESRIFVMGDHRLTSVDSRTTVVGCIAEEYIIGKVIFRMWPWEKIGTIE